MAGYILSAMHAPLSNAVGMQHSLPMIFALCLMVTSYGEPCCCI